MFAVICAVAIPNIGLLISLIGAVGCTALALIFPPLCDMATRLSRKTQLQSRFHNYIVDFGILVFGVIAMLLGTYTSLTEIILHIQTKGLK
jgi:proton-coupled amino acid transporter